VASEAGPVGAGALHAHLGQLAEGPHPADQQAMPPGRRQELGRVEDLGPLVDHRCNMDVFVGAYPADDKSAPLSHACGCLTLNCLGGTAPPAGTALTVASRLLLGHVRPTGWRASLAGTG